MQYSSLPNQLHLDVPYLRGGMDLGKGEVLTLDRFVNNICVYRKCVKSYGSAHEK